MKHDMAFYNGKRPTPFDPDGLPTELKALPHWVCWRYVTRNGKETKLPIDSATGTAASSTDSSTWGSFERSLRYYSAHRDDGITGVGFVLTDTPYTGIDLDHCRDPETDTIQPWAVGVIKKVATYAEISVSGTGVHLIAKGELPAGGKRKGCVEMYSEGRFFAMTGARLSGSPGTVRECTAELAAVHLQYIGQNKPAKVVRMPSAPVGISDQELLDVMARAANGSKVRRLLAGDHSGYPSQSEADMALCRHLAFWTGKDAERMDRLFRASGLYRPKWDTKHYGNGSTYGQETIRKTIDGTDDAYSAPKATDTVVRMQKEDPREVEPGPAGDIAGVAPLPRIGAPFDPMKYLVTGTQLKKMDVEVRWLVEDLIPEQSITTLIGPAGNGKSTACLNVGNAVERGVPWLGLATLKSPVYVIDFENPLAVDVERSRALDLSGILFWHTSAEVPPPRIDSPQYEVYKSLPPGLIIVDGHRASQRGDENSSQDTGLVMERWKELRDLGFTIILIHHTQKANAEVFRGSQALVDQADHCLYFYPVRQPGSDDPVVLDDLDSTIYFLGTKDKTRFKPCRLYLKRAGSGRFTTAGDPDDERVGCMKGLLGDCGTLTQREFVARAREKLGLGKALTLRLLKRGEAKRVWKIVRGDKNACLYQLSCLSPL
ncbi:MAG: AAA family ATPase [Syntrophorhabdales bacterium]|jgi:hypothetical protein